MLLVKFLITILVNFYSLSFIDINGTNISMNSFKTKKVYIVSMATGAPAILLNQLNELKQIQTLYADSVQVIAFPSNSFGNEARTNNEIKQFLLTNYNANFIIASKSNVKGANINTIFSWLLQQNKNGQVSVPCGGDFEKILIANDGQIVGIYAPKVSAMDSEIIEVINRSYY